MQMAIIFELWAECESQEDAQRFANHFSGFSHPVRDGRIVSWKTDPISAAFHPAGFCAFADGLSRYGVRTINDALDATEAGLRAYHHLLSAPPFRYALIDWEAANFPMCDLPTYVEGNQPWLQLECIMDERRWEEIGRPKGTVPFRPGYRWRPYSGEHYRPLGSSDHPELLALEKELFPK